jgi:outer membrane protein assembly factor BamB/predicted phosphohydrolase
MLTARKYFITLSPVKSQINYSNAKRLMKIFILMITAVTVLAAQPPLKFAHITDTHIGNATAAEDLQRTVADINSLDGLSFVLITGDITEAGFDDELRNAKQILDGLELPWYIIPGNHDMKWSGSGGFSFQKIFGYERAVFDYQGFRFIGMHQGPLLKMGDGHWSPQDVRWLDSVLSRTSRTQPVFFFTHYPLNSEIANWFDVLDKLKPYNIQAALFGHGHGNRTTSFEGIAGVMGRSNLRARDSVGGYNIVEVRNDSLIYTERKSLYGIEKTWLRKSLTRSEVPDEPILRPSFAVNDSFPHIRTKWKHQTGYTIASSPAMFRDNIVVGDASGRVIALNKVTGKKQWSFTAGGPVYSTPAVDQENIIFASTDSTIYCINGKKGNVVWKLKTDASVVASPVIRKGIAYIGGSDGTFRAIDVNKGILKWKYDGIGGFVECTPAYHNEKIIFGAWDEYVYCLDARTGNLVWKWRSDRKGTLLSAAACEPVVSDGKVFIVAPDRHMTAIDLDSGTTVWRTNQFRVRETIGLSEDGMRVYVRTMNDSLYALSAKNSQPDVLWGLNAQFGYDINSAMIKEKDGLIFYPTKNGLLIAVDGITGELLWKYKTGVGVTNTVLPLSGKNVIVTDFDGVVKSVEETK